MGKKNTIAHPTVHGWCCACDADKAFMNLKIKDAIGEYRENLVKWAEENREELSYYGGKSYVGRDELFNFLKKQC